MPAKTSRLAAKTMRLAAKKKESQRHWPSFVGDFLLIAPAERCPQETGWVASVTTLEECSTCGVTIVLVSFIAAMAAS